MTPPRPPKPPADSTDPAQLRRNLESLTRAMELQTELMARQGQQMGEILSLLRRREKQLKRAQAEIRKLRRQLGLVEPEPEPEPDPDSPSGGAPSAGAPSADPACGTPDAGRSPSSPESTESTGSNSGHECSPADDAAQPDAGSSKRGGGGGRRPPPGHLPSTEERHCVDACQTCGGRVLKRDVLIVEIYSAVQAHVRRRIIKRERNICAAEGCGTATTAPMPPMPCERTLYDCRFLAWLVFLKFVMLVPLDRIRLMLQQQDVHLSMGTLVRLIERAADLAGPIDGEHFKQLKRGRWFGFDGTGLKALVLGQTTAWDAYLEVYARDELTVFRFDLTKYADGLAERIGDYAGILVADAESRNAAGALKATFAHCNAHAVRKFKAAEDVQPKLAARAGRFLKAIYALEEVATKDGLSGAARTAFRQRHSRRVLRRFRQWRDLVLARPLPPSDPLRRAARYYVKHWETLTRFVDDGDLPIDNNVSEREFQRHAKLRLASLFAGSPEGGHRWAILLGVAQTAMKCGVDVMSYLTWLFERRGSHRHRFGMTAAELTPMAYRARGCPGAIQAAA